MSLSHHHSKLSHLTIAAVAIVVVGMLLWTLLPSHRGQRASLAHPPRILEHRVADPAEDALMTSIESFTDGKGSASSLSPRQAPPDLVGKSQHSRGSSRRLASSCKRGLNISFCPPSKGERSIDGEVHLLHPTVEKIHDIEQGRGWKRGNHHQKNSLSLFHAVDNETISAVDSFVERMSHFWANKTTRKVVSAKVPVGTDSSDSWPWALRFRQQAEEPTGRKNVAKERTEVGKVTAQLASYFGFNNNALNDKRFSAGSLFSSGRGGPMDQEEEEQGFDKWKSWVSTDSSSLLPFTEYAQRQIANAQHPLPSNRSDGLRSGQADYTSSRYSSCDTAPKMIVELPEKSVQDVGLGAYVTFLLTMQLAHAISLGRMLIFKPADSSADHKSSSPSPFFKWTGDTNTNPECAKRGFFCFFLPPSPCEFKPEWIGEGGRNAADVYVVTAEKPDDGKLASISKSTVIYKKGVLAPPKKKGSKHFLVSELLPKDVSPTQLFDLTDLSMSEWVDIQLVRYLLREVQPWLKVVILAEMESLAGFPSSFYPPPHMKQEEEMDRRLPSPPIFIASHLRNGELQKDLEMQWAFKCSKVDSSAQLLMVDRLARILDREKREERTSRVKVFFSFDDPVEGWKDVLRFWSENNPGVVCGSPLVSRVDAPCRDQVADEDEQRGNDQGSRDSPKKGEGETETEEYNPITASSLSLRYANGSSTSTTAGVRVKRSLVNMFLSLAVNGGWVNNDGSSWSSLINKLRMTEGSNKHRLPYISLEDAAGVIPQVFAASSSSSDGKKNKKKSFCLVDTAPSKNPFLALSKAIIKRSKRRVALGKAKEGPSNSQD